MQGIKTKTSITLLAGLIGLGLLSACSQLPLTLPSSEDLASTGIPLSTTDNTQTSTQERSNTPEPQATSAVADKLECKEDLGSIASYQISRGGVELSGSIYTPPCYEFDLEISYPTLYLFHGATESDQQWIDLGIAETADRLINDLIIPPLIIVMPLELTWVALPENPFGDDIVTQLIPWIDNEYHTLPDREYRALGGLSRGGNWSLRIGLLHWGLFGSLGAHSTPLFYGDLERIPGWIKAIPESYLPRIYLDIGEDDNHLASALELEKVLSASMIPHDWHIYPGLHEEVYWRSHLEEYLLWYSSGWKHLLK